MSQSAQLYGLLALLVALGVFIYFRLRKAAPASARIALSLAGALVGICLPVVSLFLLTSHFRDGWNVFGLFVWGMMVLPIGGGITGFLAGLRFTASAPAERRKLNIALISTALLTPVALFGLPNILAFFLSDARADSMHERSITIQDFAASRQSLAFQIPTRDKVRALVFVDRETQQAQLIGDKEFSYSAPRFSWDGDRLLFVRQKKESRQRELVSCLVQTWRCRIVVQTDNDVVSPAEIGKDVIVYASSPLTAYDNRQRYAHHDFYLVRIGASPVKLSSFGLLALHSINVFGDKILFGAVGAGPEFAPKSKQDFLAPRSEIFELTIDRETPRIPMPAAEMEPQFYADGFSTQPSVSQDGRKIAFLNTELGKGSYRFDLIAIDTASGAKKRIKLGGNNFSRAAFVGNQMLFNELLDDRYRARAWSWSSDAIDTVIEIEFSKLYDLPHINLAMTAG